MTIIQKAWIQEWCAENSINFTDCDATGQRVPCSLDKGYKKDDLTVFVKGFNPGSRKLVVSWGGMKQEISLRVPIDTINDKAYILKHWVPGETRCPRCGGKSLNLKTDDGHKTYVCPNCYVEKVPA